MKTLVLQLVTRAIDLYSLAISTAVASLLATMVATYAGMMLTGHDQADQLRMWQHVGWMIGACLGIGTWFFGRLKIHRRLQSRKLGEQSPEEGNSTAFEAASPTISESVRAPRRSSLVSATLFFAAVGTFAGLLIGALLYVSTLSLLASPLTYVDQIPWNQLGRQQTQLAIVCIPPTSGFFLGAVLGAYGSARGLIFDG